MNVKELIEELSKHPEDTRVFFPGYVGHPRDINTVAVEEFVNDGERAVRNLSVYVGKKEVSEPFEGLFLF